MKKLLVTVIISLGLIATIKPVLAYTAHEGDLVKTPTASAIYYIDGSGYRHLFPTQATFFSWYKGDWKDQTIITISESEFLQLPISKNVTVRPGYSLIKFDNSLKMYAVLTNGKICRAPAHYGNYQYNRALTVPSGFETDYANDGVCDITESQKLPDGTLLRYTNSNDVYYIQYGQRRKVTEFGFSENNFRWDSVIDGVNWSMSYTDGSAISGREATLTSVGYNFGNYNNYTCRENWSCYNWGTCSNGWQARSCYDNNNCGTSYSKPTTAQTCYSCNENWSCGIWSSCAYNKQYRTCSDNNGCGTSFSKPALTQTCSSCTENWSCTAWSICTNSKQYRQCMDTKQCGTTYYKPIENQTCR